MNKKRGKFFMISGLLLLAAAFSLTIYNLWDEQRAWNVSLSALEQLEEEISKRAAEEETEWYTDQIAEGEPDYISYPDMEMPTVAVDGVAYIGTVEIPVQELKLPVISEWSYTNLRNAPCRYTGSVYKDDMIIAAHNYARHFRGLKNLNQGDEVRFTDMDGHVFVYEVAEVEVLGSTAVEEMQDGDWDLTLFTCTLGGQSRVTVRCEQVDEINNQT